MGVNFVIFYVTFVVSLFNFLNPAAAVWNNASDQESLLGFKAQITVDTNNFLSDWLPNISFCKWRGVTCLPSIERVCALNLSYMSLEGSISPLIGNLSALETLDLSHNTLHGPIPPQLGRLSIAKELILYYNHLEGNIPASLSGCRRLVFLALSFNRLHGSVPAELGLLTHLEIAYLGVNSLAGTIPSSLGNLSSLIELTMEMNNLTGSIPVEICKLTQLQLLILHTNQLSGIIPSSIGNLSALIQLQLGLNNLIGIIPAELAFLNKLQVLYLHTNHLSGTIPSSMGNVSSLIDLALTANNITGRIPPELGNLIQLKSLHLDENRISGAIPTSLMNSTELITLDLSQNQLSGQIPSDLGVEHSNLKGIFLWENQLSGNVPRSIGNCSELVILSLNDNQLSGTVPMELGKLDFLRTIMLSANKLVNGNSPSLAFLSALTNCSNLKYLLVSDNNLIGVLPASIGYLSSKLSELDLAQNKISGYIPQEITKLSNLTFLNMGGNLLSGPIPYGIKNFQKLERFYLTRNRLEGKIPNEIGQLKKLGLLDISWNKLSGKIPDSLGELQQLRDLYLQHNRLSGMIPIGLRRSQNLEVLDFSHNELSGNIPREILTSLRNLQIYLNLSWNFLHGPLPIEISKIVSAQAIDISGNQLDGEIPEALGSCIALEHLNLSHNAFEGPIPGSLGKLQNLQDIDLSSNFLSGPIPKSLTKLKVLHYLNLGFNNLTGSIPEEGLFPDDMITEIFMGNPSLCGPNRYFLPACPKHGKEKYSPHIVRLIITASGLGAFIFCSLVFGILWKWKYSKRQFRLSSFMFGRLGYPKFSYQDLFDATNGFAETNLLGQGNFGSVFKGILRDGREIAVKVLNMQNEHGEKSFKSECYVLGKIRHRNLIRVISACSYPDFKGLVLQFVPNGSLEHHLYHSRNGENICGLEYVECLNIAIDVAHGIEYLHHDCSVPVVHCDLKPSNVLLDADMTALVTDFGISKLDDSTNSMDSALRGSIGYIAPEYGLGGRVSTKGDVYSYGIMLLEMVTRKRPSDSMFLGDLNLHNWTRSAFPNRLADIIDSALLRSVNSQQNNYLVSLIHVGLLCTKESPHERPTMREVARGLESLRNSLLRRSEAADSNLSATISFLVRDANGSEGSQSSSY